MMEARSEAYKILRYLPVLSSLDPQAIEGLAEAAVEETYDIDQVIIEEGKFGQAMYLIVDGLVEVYKGEKQDKVILAKRGRGDLIGEMSLFESHPRFATVRAIEQTKVFKFAQQDLQAIWVAEPELIYQVVSILSDRLREADLQMISDLQIKNKELALAYKELKAAQAAIIEKERMDRELELARDLQRSILPTEFPVIPNLDIAAYYKPARQVGGDFYDVIHLGPGRAAFVIADVSDKGMPAALFMALTRSLIRAESRRSSSPRSILLNINQLLLEMSTSDMFVTVFFGILDTVAGILRYSRAGHDRPLRVDPVQKTCELLEGKGNALGVMEHPDLDEIEIQIFPGELLVMYTDGIVDAQSMDGRFFGQKRLKEAVFTVQEKSAISTCSHIFDRISQFMGDRTQYDDMALLIVKAESAS